MRKSFVALLLLAGAAACLTTAAFASEPVNGDELGLMKSTPLTQKQMPNAARQGASRFGASKALTATGPCVGYPTGTANDTVYVGFSTCASVSNYWKVGPGPNRPLAPSQMTEGNWQWDQSASTHGDSLMGWWPFRSNHTNASGTTRTDVNRAWWAIEMGNTANYVINQGAGFKRTFGVVGVWHRDPGNTATVADPNPSDPYAFPADGGVKWAPLAGSYSAWMGLRNHGDATVVDPVTNNPLNVDVIQFNGTGVIGTGSAKTFPGYASQMDQMLYRDYDISTYTSGPIVLTFLSQTQMSTGKGTTATTRTGWFEGDPSPWAPPAVNDGNLISAEATTLTDGTVGAANFAAPIDSFQVYVGKPVEGSFKGSDGTVRPIYDNMRRWFNEVLDKDHRLWVFSQKGNNAAGLRTVTIDAANAAALKAASSTLRIVFRVHTNAGTSDESSPATYTSGGMGAAQVDDVAIDIGAGAVSLGGFENASDIDNSVAGTISDTWRSTGKPPAIYFHVHQLATLEYKDLCGVDDPYSIYGTCDMLGGVVSMGDHENSERAGGLAGTTEGQGNWGAASPTVGLKGQPGVGLPNTFGLTLDDATPTQAYGLQYEMYFGIYDIYNQGNAWQFGAMSYPALQIAGGPAAGTPQWGNRMTPPFLYFEPLKRCYATLEDMSAYGQIVSANGTGVAVPDSMKIFMMKLQQCYRFGAPDCSPLGGSYMDNVSLVIIDGTPQTMAINIWDFFNDTFPFNENDALVGTSNFDTTTALIRTGLNAYPGTNNFLRFDVPADSVYIVATDIGTMRIDMVFRIKPGVGNYVTPGVPSSGLRQVVVSATPTAATPGDGTFWGSYMGAGGGEYSSYSLLGDLDATWPGNWNPNVWRSARCDTAQVGLFPVDRRGYGDGATSGFLPANQWMSCYHEADAHLPALGILRNKCFVIDTLGGATNVNITCDSVPAAYRLGLNGILNSPPYASGYDGNPQTVEGTQILPDGLLTPGAHVQYFFTKRFVGAPVAGTFDMVPDTNTVFIQPNEGNYDGHRWQQFGVLPDRWKDGAFTPGMNMACMLYVDANDRRGDEKTWVAIADSIGATPTSRWGAHNGWSAPNGVDVNLPQYRVAAHGGQPGGMWDMYGVKASESLTTSAGALGSRLSNRATPGLVEQGGVGKYSHQGPTPAMLAQYYKVMLILTGDLNSGVFGPFPDRSQDDIGTGSGLLPLWMQNADASNPRVMMIQGDGWIEDTAWNSYFPEFLDNFGMTWIHASYRAYANNQSQMSELHVLPALGGASDIYGVRNACTYTNDVSDVNPLVTEAQVAEEYTPMLSVQYVAGVYKPNDGLGSGRWWTAFGSGYDITHLTGKFGAVTVGPDHKQWNQIYYASVLAALTNGVCSFTGTPITGVESPNSPDYVNFVKLGNNPVVNRQALVLFSLAKSDRVQLKVYDVTGRLIRTLADRVFDAGPHNLTWDGVDDHGSLVPRGVYFARTTFAGQNFQSNNKMIVLN